MAIFKKTGDSCAFVWGADPDTNTDLPEAAGGWYYADGQPAGCTVVEVQALSEDQAVAAVQSTEAAWREGVIAVNGETGTGPDGWPPIFARAVSQLVQLVASGVVGLVPPAA